MSNEIVKMNPRLPVAQVGIPATRQWLEGRIGMLEQVAPPGTPVRQIVALAVGEIVDTPKLQGCTPISILRCAMVSAELGLSIGKVTGELYPVPYDKTCTPIVGYKGMLRLIRRDPRVANIYAEVVYDGDRFEVVRGTNPDLVHVPDLRADRSDSKIEFAYAVIRFTDGTSDFEYLTRAEIDKIRKSSRAGQNGPWVQWYSAMAEKTALRALYKRHQWANDTVAKAAALEAQDAGETITGVFETDRVIDEVAQFAELDPEPVSADPAPSGKAAFVAVCKTAQRDASTEPRIIGYLRELVPMVLEERGTIDKLTEADWQYSAKAAQEAWLP